MDDDEDTISEACMKVKSGHQVITQLHAIKYTEKDPQRACVCVCVCVGYTFQKNPFLRQKIRLKDTI